MKHYIRDHLKDNTGDVNMQKMIIIATLFILGALLITAVVVAIDNSYEDGIKGIIHDIMH